MELVLNKRTGRQQPKNKRKNKNNNRNQHKNKRARNHEIKLMLVFYVVCLLLYIVVFFPCRKRWWYQLTAASVRSGTGDRNGYRGHLSDRAVDLNVACRYKAFPGYFWVYVPPILFGLLGNQGMQQKRLESLESQTVSGSRLIISRFLLYHQDECYPSLERGCCCSRCLFHSVSQSTATVFWKTEGSTMPNKS